MGRNGDRGLAGGDREILDRGLGFHRTGDRWMPDRWPRMPGQGLSDPGTIAGLKLWLKADSIALADGTATATWPDSSAGGSNFTQGTGVNQPIYKTAIVNSKPVERFDGINDTMLATTALISSSTRYTIFVVYSAASNSAGSHNLFASGNGAAFSMQLRREATGLWFYHNASGGLSFTTDPGGVVPGTWNIATCDWDGTNCHLWRGGILKDTHAATGTTLSAGSDNSLGSDHTEGGIQFWDGDIAEVLFYDPVLVNADRQSVENSLKTKYAIP
jgi:Concanavalin A-like lectin/glucanases superfamily